MEENQFKSLLDENNQYSKVRNIYDQLILSSQFHDMDVDTLDAFLTHFELKDDITFEEFIGLYKIFDAIYEKDKFPIIF
ncbi:hypothetical protein [Metabacillus endolithicus]|uniref:Uncharacterized protein n=1 Tax=Metabacillus endolithicus TaxID=1535204 RepID=A0ABW5BU41_9BACI|nr:hypothetical protein [Metabacillus endolithicus]UPG64847.1 hypothetical protein MVE64_07350 [Metabacillus endolithicus]